MGWFARGLGFVIKRRLTGAKKQDRAAYLNTVADVGAKMRQHGMTLEEIGELEALMQNPAVAASSGVTEVVEQAANDEEPSAFLTNYAMKVRTGTAYSVADAQLNQALEDLRLLMTDKEWECLEKVQEHWKAYRHSLAESGRLEFEGGTHAGLASIFVALSETERRGAEVRAQVEERARR